MSVMYICVYVCTYTVHTNVAMCVYLCTYIVRMNVAMYVCNPSDMLQAQPDGTKIFKHSARILLSSLIWNKEYCNFVCWTSKKKVT